MIDFKKKKAATHTHDMCSCPVVKPKEEESDILTDVVETVILTEAIETIMHSGDSTGGFDIGGESSSSGSDWSGGGGDFSGGGSSDSY